MQETRIALVTGAARGLGLAIAAALARDGHHVVLVDRLQEVGASAERLAASGLSVEAAVADVSREDDVKSLVAARAEQGRLDVLVNNAGVSLKHADGSRQETETMSTADWQTTLAINLTGAFLLCREAIPLMKARGWGRIVNMSSRAGRTLVPTAGAHYAATKAGLIGLTRVLAGELGPYGITANCVAPGRIESAMGASMPDEVRRDLRRTIPVGTVGAPEDVAAAIVFLASDAARYVTGAVIDINGGAFMG